MLLVPVPLLREKFLNDYRYSLHATSSLLTFCVADFESRQVPKAFLHGGEPWRSLPNPSRLLVMVCRDGRCNAFMPSRLFVMVSRDGRCNAIMPSHLLVMVCRDGRCQYHHAVSSVGDSEPWRSLPTASCRRVPSCVNYAEHFLISDETRSQGWSCLGRCAVRCNLWWIHGMFHSRCID